MLLMCRVGLEPKPLPAVARLHPVCRLAYRIITVPVELRATYNILQIAIATQSIRLAGVGSCRQINFPIKDSYIFLNVSSNSICGV